MDLKKLTCKTSHTAQTNYERSVAGTIYSVVLNYLNKQTKISLSTKTFYAKKYLEIKSKERKPNSFDELEVR